MFVDRETRQLAMYYVYRSIRIHDNVLRATDLAAAWRKTGLRDSDLAAVLWEMQDRGFLSEADQNSDKRYLLTPAGVGEFRLSRISLTYGVIHWITLFRIWFRAHWRSRRALASARPPHDRRASPA